MHDWLLAPPHARRRLQAEQVASLGGGSSSTAGAPAASSRFNLDVMEEKKAPAFQRGKDGHLTLNAGDDFFSNPMGGGSSRQASLGERPASKQY